MNIITQSSPLDGSPARDLLQHLTEMAIPELPVPTAEQVVQDALFQVEIHAYKRTGKEWRPMARRIKAVGGKYSDVRGYTSKRFITVPGTALDIIDDLIKDWNNTLNRPCTVISRGYSHAPGGTGCTGLRDEVCRATSAAHFVRLVTSKVRYQVSKGRIAHVDTAGRKRTVTDQ